MLHVHRRDSIDKVNPQYYLEKIAVESDARKLNVGSISPFCIRCALSSEIKVVRPQQSKSHTSEPRELAMLSTCRSLVSGSVFEIYLNS